MNGLEAVRLRWNNGVLEYSSLIVHDNDIPMYNECSLNCLQLEWRELYTEWKPVPQKDEDERPCMY